MPQYKITIELDSDTGKIGLVGPVEKPIIMLGMLDYGRMLVFRNEEEKRVAAGLSKESSLQAPPMQLIKNSRFAEGKGP